MACKKYIRKMEILNFIIFMQMTYGKDWINIGEKIQLETASLNIEKTHLMACT